MVSRSTTSAILYFNARYSSGQRGMTVNHLPIGFGSSNLPLATNLYISTSHDVIFYFTEKAICITEYEIYMTSIIPNASVRFKAMG